MPKDVVQGMLSCTGKILDAAKILQVPVLLTEQYPQGLGPTEARIVNKLPDNTQQFSKTGFSCCAATGFQDKLQAMNKQQLILVGMESHVCVLQTALELLQNGYQVYVVCDAVCSRNIEHKLNSLQRMQQLGITIINYESVLFEWLRGSHHPDFKKISALLS